MTHPRCRTRYGIDGIFSFFRYDGIVKKAIKDVKYRFVSDIVEELISHAPKSSFELLTSYLLPHTSCILVPIPLHWSRANFRGFNQSEVLALKLAKRLNIPVWKDMLVRKQRTKPQVEMKSRKDRFKNMEEVFQINRNNEAMKRWSNVAIILVDDVSTTGATLRSAASVLKRTGATYVFGVTIAQ
jgi:ComF family protein